MYPDRIYSLWYPYLFILYITLPLVWPFPLFLLHSCFCVQNWVWLSLFWAHNEHSRWVLFQDKSYEAYNGYLTNKNISLEFILGYQPIVVNWDPLVQVQVFDTVNFDIQHVSITWEINSDILAWVSTLFQVNAQARVPVTVCLRDFCYIQAALKWLYR